MARTNRKYMTDGNYREARKGRSAQRAVDAATDFRFADTGEPVWGDYGRHEAIRSAALPAWGHRNNHGGMIASPSNSGFWRDEITDSNSVLRQRERRAFLRDLDAELGSPEALDAREFYCGSPLDAEDWAAERADEDEADFYIEDDYGYPVFVGPTYYDEALDASWRPKSLSC